MASPTQLMSQDQIFKHTHDVAASVLSSEALLNSQFYVLLFRE